MLVTLILALLAVDPDVPKDDPWRRPIDREAFCRDLTAMIGAASEAPAAFASLPTDGGEIQPMSRRGVESFNRCYLTYADVGEGLPTVRTLRCTRPAWRPLAESREETVQAVAACTGAEPLAVTDGWGRATPETRFESAAWTIGVEENGCDRCRGMPHVDLWLRPRPPSP